MSKENNEILKSENILGTESVYKLMFKYCLPAVISMIITGVQGMIDGMFVGNYVGANALASVNIAWPFMSLIIGVAMVIGIGAQSYIGINLGAGNTQKAQDAFKTFLVIISCVSLLITILGLTLNREIAAFLGADNILLSDVSDYIKYSSIFALPACLMFYFGFLSRIVGEPERYLYGTIISVIVNVCLDYLLIAQFEMGVMGAAIATGSAFSSGLLFVTSPMLKKDNIISVFKGKFFAESILPVLYNGSSEGINSLSSAVTLFLFNISLMKIAGAGGVTAFTAIAYVGSVGSMLLFGISDGIGPIISYNYGMHDYKRVKQIMKISYSCNLIFGVILFVILFFNGEFLVGLFINDSPELVTLATQGSRLYALAFLLSGFNILTSGYFTYIGKGLESVLVAASRGVIFVSIGIFTLPIFLDINGIWLSVPFAEFSAVLVGLILLKITNKKLNTNEIVSSYENTDLALNQKETVIDAQDLLPRVITINRQFGSGGREVGKRLAEQLRCHYYDKELLNIISKETGVNSLLIDELDSNTLRSFGYTTSRSFAMYKQLPVDEIANAKNNIMKKLAEKSNAVFIGRCSDYILNDYQPLKIYIYSSSMDYKINRCFNKVPEDKERIGEKEIAKDIITIDKNRARYYENQTGQKWDDMSNYNLCIDTSKVGIQGAVNIIVSALKEV